jgi:hypothetical protein
MKRTDSGANTDSPSAPTRSADSDHPKRLGRLAATEFDIRT